MRPLTRIGGERRQAHWHCKGGGLFLISNRRGTATAMRIDVLFKRYPCSFGSILSRSSGVPKPNVQIVCHRAGTRDQRDRFGI